MLKSPNRMVDGYKEQMVASNPESSDKKWVEALGVAGR